MLFALDKDGNRVYAKEAEKGKEYFCPLHGEQVILRKGDIKIHHFAHNKGDECCDDWNHDMSEWHIEKQSMFPRECQEVPVEKDGKKHRADVLTNGIVIEFQHSPIPLKEYKDRNDFYLSLGYKVVWVFDVDKNKGDWVVTEDRNPLETYYYWGRAKGCLKATPAFKPEYQYSEAPVTVYFAFKDADGVERLHRVAWWQCVEGEFPSTFKNFSLYKDKGLVLEKGMDPSILVKPFYCKEKIEWASKVEEYYDLLQDGCMVDGYRLVDIDSSDRLNRFTICPKWLKKADLNSDKSCTNCKCCGGIIERDISGNSLCQCKCHYPKEVSDGNVKIEIENALTVVPLENGGFTFAGNTERVNERWLNRVLQEKEIPVLLWGIIKTYIENIVKFKVDVSLLREPKVEKGVMKIISAKGYANEMYVCPLVGKPFSTKLNNGCLNCKHCSGVEGLENLSSSFYPPYKTICHYPYIVRIPVAEGIKECPDLPIKPAEKKPLREKYTGEVHTGYHEICITKFICEETNCKVDRICPRTGKPVCLFVNTNKVVGCANCMFCHNINVAVIMGGNPYESKEFEIKCSYPNVVRQPTYPEELKECNVLTAGISAYIVDENGCKKLLKVFNSCKEYLEELKKHEEYKKSVERIELSIRAIKLQSKDVWIGSPYKDWNHICPKSGKEAALETPDGCMNCNFCSCVTPVKLQQSNTCKYIFKCTCHYPNGVREGNEKLNFSEPDCIYDS